MHRPQPQDGKTPILRGKDDAFNDAGERLRRFVKTTENHCEGMVPMRDLDDDYYDFDERNFCLVGRRRHHKYQLGDKIRIKVASANVEKKQLDFVLAASKK